jgi:hypothetical protein
VDAPQEAKNLVARLSELGATIRLRPDGTPQLVPPRDPYWRGKALELLPQLALHKQAVIAHFAGLAAGRPVRCEGDSHPGRRCRECRAFVFTDDPLEVAVCCALVQCPLKIPDAAFEARERRQYWAKKRREES